MLHAAISLATRTFGRNTVFGLGDSLYRQLFELFRSCILLECMDFSKVLRGLGVNVKDLGSDMSQPPLLLASETHTANRKYAATFFVDRGFCFLVLTCSASRAQGLRPIV